MNAGLFSQLLAWYHEFFTLPGRESMRRRNKEEEKQLRWRNEKEERNEALAVTESVVGYGASNIFFFFKKNVEIWRVQFYPAVHGSINSHVYYIYIYVLCFHTTKFFLRFLFNFTCQAQIYFIYYFVKKFKLYIT